MSRREVLRAMASTCAVVVLTAAPAGAQYGQGSIVAWGDNGWGQLNVPAPNTDFVAVAGGNVHSLALKADGSIAAWGSNTLGQLNVPAPNTDFVAVAGGLAHSLGLKADGSIVAWGRNYEGQCGVPAPDTDFVAVAAGGYHSLGVKADGSIVAWGDNYYGQTDVPAPNTGFMGVAAGHQHSLGLKDDGSIVAWGNNNHGQCNVPAPNSDFVAVGGGGEHTLGLKADGSIVAWGYNGYGQSDVPAPNSNFVGVAAGSFHSLGLKADGSIVAWGRNHEGQCGVPAPNTDFVAVAAGYYHSLGIKGYPRGDLDIKPGSCPNPFNRTSNGVLPVGLLGTAEFDVTLVDITTVQLSRADGAGGSVAPLAGPPGPHSVFADVGTPFDGELCDCHELTGDGIDDLSMKFKTQTLVDVLELNDIPFGGELELVLTGELLDGTPLEARDCILILGPVLPRNFTVGSNQPDTYIEVTPPDLGVDGDGFTSFDRCYFSYTPVTVAAPGGANGKPLSHWKVDGVAQPQGQRTIQVTVEGIVTLEAVYRARSHRLTPIIGADN